MTPIGACRVEGGSRPTTYGWSTRSKTMPPSGSGCGAMTLDVTATSRFTPDECMPLMMFGDAVAVEGDGLLRERHAERGDHSVGAVDGGRDRGGVVHVATGDDEAFAIDGQLGGTAGEGDDVVTGVEGQAGEESARGSVGSEDGQVHGGTSLSGVHREGRRDRPKRDRSGRRGWRHRGGCNSSSCLLGRSPQQIACSRRPKYARVTPRREVGGCGSAKKWRCAPESSIRAVPDSWCPRHASSALCGLPALLRPHPARRASVIGVVLSKHHAMAVIERSRVHDRRLRSGRLAVVHPAPRGWFRAPPRRVRPPSR